MSDRPDPLQLPETAGEVRDEASPWLAWLAISIVAAVVAIYGLALVGFAGTDLAIMAFAVGMFWDAITPAIVRRIARRLDG